MGFKNLEGKRFGRLIVVSRVKNKNKIKDTHAHWLCRCDCGNECIVISRNLIRGTTKSCGCLQKDMCKQKNSTHGMSDTRLYRIHQSMKRRCYNEHDTQYARYGGRGIKMCKEWTDDFYAFARWAYANGYDENAKYGKCTIERIDNDRDYCPENCRWATLKEQCRNRSSCRLITYDGKTMTVVEWAEYLGVSDSMIRNRLGKGLPLDIVLAARDLRRKAV